MTNTRLDDLFAPTDVGLADWIRDAELHRVTHGRSFVDFAARLPDGSFGPYRPIGDFDFSGQLQTVVDSPEYARGRVIVGVDVARPGGDESVAVTMHSNPDGTHTVAAVDRRLAARVTQERVESLPDPAHFVPIRALAREFCEAMQRCTFAIRDAFDASTYLPPEPEPLRRPPTSASEVEHQVFETLQRHLADPPYRPEPLGKRPKIFRGKPAG